MGLPTIEMKMQYGKTSLPIKAEKKENKKNQEIHSKKLCSLFKFLFKEAEQGTTSVDNEQKNC